MVYKSGQIFLPFCHNARVWRTDGQTDGRTDRRTEFSSLDRVCIACSAVKMCHITTPQWQNGQIATTGLHIARNCSCQHLQQKITNGIMTKVADGVQNVHHQPWHMIGDDATDERLPNDDVIQLGTSLFSVAVSVRLNQRRVLCTPSLAVFRTPFRQLD